MAKETKKKQAFMEKVTENPSYLSDTVHAHSINNKCSTHI